MTARPRPPDGFAEYMAARRSSLVRAGWLLTGDPDKADDLVQTVLTRLWLDWARTKHVDNVDAYVRRMLFTTYLTWWRRRWRFELPTAALPEPADASDLAASAADRHAIRCALARLTRRQRAVIVLRYLEDLSVENTAEVLGCSPATIKTHTSRALAVLRTDPALRSWNFEQATHGIP